MVYGISFCPISKNTDLKELGVDDSKVLTEEKREELFGKLEKNSDYIGWAITVLSPRYISTSMFKRSKYNLNTMSHDTAIDLVKLAIEKGRNQSIIGLLKSEPYFFGKHGILERLFFFTCWVFLPELFILKRINPKHDDQFVLESGVQTLNPRLGEDIK